MHKTDAQVDRVAWAKATAEFVGQAASELIESLQPATEVAKNTRAMLYLNIAESFHVCNVLVRAGLDAHGTLHVRSMLESLTHMRLLKSQFHLKQMRFDEIDGDLKTCKKLLLDPHLTESVVKELQARVEEFTPEHVSLKAQGCKRRVIADDIIEADLSFLAPMYSQLNSVAHWDLGALTDHYCNEDGSLKAFAKTRPGLTFGTLFLAIQMMVMATEEVKDVARFSEGAYELQFAKMNRAWGMFLDSTEGQFPE